MYGRFQRRRRSCDCPGNRIPGPVSATNLRQTLADSHWLTVGASRHVAVDERIRQLAWWWPELADQLSREAALLGFCQRTRVMRNHPAQQRLGVFGVAEMPGAIQRVESGVMQIGRISDVVQPSRRLNQVGIFSEKTP